MVTIGMCVFFFQAEDGIRDVAVTGVQTCALPISRGGPHHARRPRAVSVLRGGAARLGGPRSPGGPAAGRAVDVGGGDDLSVGGGERGLVPVVRPGRTRRRGWGGAAGSVRQCRIRNAECGTEGARIAYGDHLIDRRPSIPHSALRIPHWSTRPRRSLPGDAA